MKFRSNCFLRSRIITPIAMTLAGLVLIASQSAQAASGIWTSAGDGDWSDTTKWAGGPPGVVANGATFTATFTPPTLPTGSTAVTTTTTLDSSRTLGNISKGTTGTAVQQSWLITSATNVITLDNGASNSQVLNSPNNNSMITVDTDIVLNSNLLLSGNGNANAKVTLGATVNAHTITGAKNITFSNTSSGNGGALTVNSTINTTGAITNSSTVGQALAINGNIINALNSVTQSGIGAAGLTLTGANTYAGGTNVSAGTLNAQDGLTATPGTNNFIKALGTNTLTLSGGTLNLKANGSGSAQTIITGDGVTGNNVAVTGNTTISVNLVAAGNTGNTIQLNNLTIGAQTLITTAANTYGLQFAGTTTLSGTATLNTSGATGLLTLAGAVGDGGSGFGINKAGIGTLILTGANTYTGATVHGGGTLSINTLYNAGTASSLGAATGANGNVAIGSTIYTGTLIFTGTGGDGTTGTNGYTDRVINLAGTTGGVTLTQSGTGQLKFVNALSATGVGAKTLTLQGSTAGTGEIAGAIVDSTGGATAVTKSGSGAWTISGPNTYTGATSVTAGALILSGTAIPDANSLSVTGTGTVSVAGAGTETVGSLTLGGITYTTGSFNSANSAGFVTSGTIQVVAATAGYSSWATLNGASASLSADHDNDGVSNGVEYFIGGPTGNTTGFTAVPPIVTTGGVQSITFTHAANYTGVYGTDFFVETSTTLAAGSWITEALNVNVVITGNNVKYTFPAGTIRFARLRVTGP